jgi:hypothetical protein
VLTAVVTLAVLIVLALIATVAAVGARSAQRAVAARAGSADAEQRADRIRERLQSSRVRLVEIQTETERGLWRLSRVDEHVESATQRLRDSRVTIADQHARLLAAHNLVDRLRWALRALVRLNELRRTVIG